MLAPATRADLDALPATWRGEIIRGVLYAFPRPRATHASTEGNVVFDLGNPFHRGRGGPGGWWILPEPGIRLPEADEFSPDVGGWRRDRLPVLPSEGPIEVTPDWLCEILSPSTRSYDLIVKRRFYAAIGVQHIWYVDLEALTLTASKLAGDRWLELGVYGPDDVIRVEPFDAIELKLADWFEGIPAGPG